MQQRDHVGHVSALKFTPDGKGLFAGIGSFLNYFYNTNSLLTVLEEKSCDDGYKSNQKKADVVRTSWKIFPSGERIHGIRLFQMSSFQSKWDQVVTNEILTLCVFGGRRIKLVEMRFQVENFLRIPYLSSYYEFEELDDWIFDVIWLERESILAVGFAHNFISFYKRHTNDETALGKSEFELISNVRCEDRSLLYSMAFSHSNSIEDLQVGCGTVFNQLLVWKPTIQSQDSDILMLPFARIKAHDGVIFHIGWKGMMQLVTVSDDRTVKMWSLAKDSFDESKYNLKLEFSDYVHQSRVFRCWTCEDQSFPFFVSGGEDGHVKVLTSETKLVGKTNGLFSAHSSAIWSIDCTIMRDDNNTFVQIASGGGDGDIRISNFIYAEKLKNSSTVDKSSYELPKMYAPNQRHYVRDMYWLDSSAIAIVCNLGSIFIPNCRNESSWDTIFTLEDQEEEISCSAFSGSAIFIGTSWGRVLMVEIDVHNSRRSVQLLEFADNTVVTMFFSNNHLLISLSTCIGELLLFRIIQEDFSISCEKVCTLDNRGSVKFTAGLVLGEFVVTADVKGFLSLFSSADGKFLMRIVAHNHKRIMDVSIHPVSGEIWSVGRNGCLAKFKVKSTEENDELIDMQSPELVSVGGLSAPVKSVDRISWWNMGTWGSENDLVAAGFEGKELIVWNFSQKTEICRIPSKGGQRAFDIKLDIDRNQICYGYFVSDENTVTLHHFKFGELKFVNNSFSVGSLHVKYHGRLTSAVKFLSHSLMVSSSEDNSMKLVLYSDQTSQLSLCSSVERKSRDAIKCIDSSRISSVDSAEVYIICSGGVSEHLQVYEVCDDGKKVETLASIGGSKFVNFRNGKWWKKNETTLMEERQEFQDLRTLSIKLSGSHVRKNI